MTTCGSLDGGRENPVPDTGTLGGDLRALLTQAVGLIERAEVGRVTRTGVSRAANDDEVVRANEEFWVLRFTGAAAIVSRAVGQGELPSDTDPYELIEDLTTLTYLRLLTTDRPVDDRLIDHSVELARCRQCIRAVSASGRGDGGHRGGRKDVRL